MQGGAYLLCGILVGCHLTEGKWAALFGEIAFCLIGLASIYSGAFGGAKRVGQEIRFLLTGNMELLEQRDCDRLATLARDIGETSKADKLTCIKASE